METLLIIILIVFGVLQVILFIKIWDITNSVKRIKDNLCPHPFDKVRKHVIKGENDKIEESLIDALIFDIESLRSSSDYSSIQHVKDVYKPLFDKIGFTFPDIIERINTISDYNNVLNTLTKQ